MNKVKLLFKDMTFGTSYEFLDEAKSKDELSKIAKKRGLVLPSPDLSIFKGRYAFVDRQNKNGCTLPKEEVKKALGTLIGKAIDIDHLRKSVIGTWIDAELEGDEIVTYGSLLKSNFKEEYGDFKKRMEEGTVKISFESWGNRIYKDTNDIKKGYDLMDIHFAGGALLFNEDPAFEDAEVLEFAQIIETGSPDMPHEMFKIITEEKIVTTTEYKKDETITNKEVTIENTRFFKDGKKETNKEKTNTNYFYNYSSIILESFIEGRIEDIDEELESAYISSIEGEQLLEGDISVIEEAKKLSTKERKAVSDDLFAVITTVKNKKTDKSRKIRMFPINDENHVRNALARLPQATKTLQKLGISVDDVKEKILKRARELNMKDLLKRQSKGGMEFMNELLKKYNKATVEDLAYFLDKEVELAKNLVKEVESGFLKVIEESAESLKMCMNTKMKDGMAAKEAMGECLKMMKSSLDTEIASLKEKVKVLETEKAATEKVQKDAKIKTRKDELGEEFAKDIKDEDILDDIKFENLKLKKEKAALEAIIKKDPEKAKELEIIAGAKDKKIDDSISQLADKVRKSFLKDPEKDTE